MQQEHRRSMRKEYEDLLRKEREKKRKKNKEFLKERRRFMWKGDPKRNEFADHLESLSENSLVVPMPLSDEELSGLVEKGKLLSYPVRKFPMKRSRCHFNASCLNWCFPDRFAKQYGFALTDVPHYADLWGEHSWGFDKEKKVVIETTTPRTKYYGFTLDEDLGENFVDREGDPCPCDRIEKELL